MCGRQSTSGRFQVYLVSSRVHPGETPASYVFNGFLDFITNANDPRSKALRQNFVIKLIPLLNPDGVVRGHYRTDARGVNLNRMYMDPSFDSHPSIYAAKSLLCYYHVNYRVHRSKESLGTPPAFPSTPPPFERPKTHSPSPVSQDEASKRVKSRSPVTGRQARKPVHPLKASTSYTEGMRAVSGNDAQNGSAMKSNSASRVTLVAHSSSSSDSLRSPVRSKSHDVRNTFPPVERETVLSAFKPSPNPSRDTVRSSTDGASGGEYDDPSDIGNEGSDEEGVDCTPHFDGVIYNSPHLSDPALKEIPPCDSGIALYVDLHGHASKRGCFIYGNYLESEDYQTENMLFPKLIALNSAHFDFHGCNFTERNMYMKDKKDGLSKMGAGRVAMYKTLGIVHR